MGRLHSNGKGISASAVPYSRNPPSWLKTTPEQVVDQICKLAKKGATPSQIGVVLRDSHGIAQVRIVTGTLYSGGGGLGEIGGSALTGSRNFRQQDPPYPQGQWYDLRPDSLADEHTYTQKNCTAMAFWLGPWCRV
jgi:hypothetical protein